MAIRHRTQVVGYPLVMVVALALPSVAMGGPAGHRSGEVINGRPVAAGEALVHMRAIPPAAGALVDSDIDQDEPVGTGDWRLVHSRGRSAQALVLVMRARGDIDAAEPNYAVAAATTPNDLNSTLWGLQNTGQQLPTGDIGTAGADIGAVSAWDTTTGSRRVVVGVVDTGVMAGHQDLTSNMWTAPRSFTVTVGGVSVSCAAGTHGYNAIARTCDGSDDNGHGTHVAGSIGAAGNNGFGVVGVNWVTSLMSLKFMDQSGNGYVSDAVNAIEFAIQTAQAFASTGDANVRVLNNSWSGGDYSQALRDEIQRASDANMLFVAAGGNTSTNHDTTLVYPAAYAVANVLGTAATDDHDQLASYSDFGPTTMPIAAPGTAINSTVFDPANPTASGYAIKSGTSMAAAYLSGASALVLAHCSYSTGALRNALLTTATSLASLSGTIQSGRRLNAAAAVRSCDTTTASTPADIVLYSSDIAAADRHGAWTSASDATAAGGAKMTTPDNGVANTSAPLAAPSDYFDAHFNASAGVSYHLWLRLHATADSKYNDSVWVQFSDATVNGSPVYQLNSANGMAINLENCSGCAMSGWGWQDKAYWLMQPAVLRFSSSGAHTLRVQTREDGVEIDQIVLSPSTYLSAAPGGVTYDTTIVPKPGTGSSGSATPSSTPYSGTPAAVPGTIQAENFDNGGQGIAYRDTTAGNSGGAYRSTDVDIENASSGGYDVGWLDAGEWLAYTVNVASAGTYTASIRVACSGQGGTFHLEANGARVGTEMTIPDTGGWQNWQTVTTSATLSAGTRVLRVVIDTLGSIAAGNIDSMTFTAASTATISSTPFNGVIALPGRIEAENFDNGGEGVAYHDTSSGNSGGAYRATDVDLEAASEGTYDVGWSDAGEWLKYTVSVATAGSYTMQFRVASASSGGTLHVMSGSTNLTGSVALPVTRGWQNWTTVSVPVTFAAGQQTITVVFDSPGFNVNYIDVR